MSKSLEEAKLRVHQLNAEMEKACKELVNAVAEEVKMPLVGKVDDEIYLTAAGIVGDGTEATEVAVWGKVCFKTDEKGTLEQVTFVPIYPCFLM